MKKKIISLFMVFCLMIPCFFAVACKDKDNDDNDSAPKGIDPYTYSVTLKNAKGLIDENSLQVEYDYEKQEDVDWTASGNDYTISVVRNNVLSGDFDISLLEGYDYSNISFSVNEESKTASIVSGTKTDCEKDAYLTDREFHYEYVDMKSSTSLVVDFSNCAWAKVTVNFEELNSQGIKAYTAANEFVTISTEIEDAMNEVETEEVQVDYGTIFAFDCTQKIVFKSNTSENFQNLNLSKFGSKYYIGNDIVQYFTAKQDGECLVYNAVKDYSNRGTLRVLGCDDVIAYSTLDALKENTNAITPEIAKETYGGSLLNINVVEGPRMFLKLSGDAQNYSYYLVENIDTKIGARNELTPQTIEGSSVLYLDINIVDNSGEAGQTKYLVRKPKNELNFYTVYAREFTDNTRIANADYILVGSSNKPDVASSHDGIIYYGFAKQVSGGEAKSVAVELSAYTSDRTTDFVKMNINVEIEPRIIYNEPVMDERFIEPTFQEPLSSSIISVDCYDEVDGDVVYEILVNYKKSNFTDANVTLNTAELELYEGEKVLYTTNILDNESWKVLTTESALSISSEKTKRIFYYFDSNRNDTYLQIQNQSAEVVSVTNLLRDCFGRPLTGKLTVDGTEMDLSKVRYLDIKPGSYSAYTGKLLREYDKSSHNIKFAGIEANKVMVSLNGYTADGSSFVDLKNLSSLSIEYNGYNASGLIYYYVNSSTNEYLVLKDSQGNIVSTSKYVAESNQKELLINGKYVYCLSLVGDYYAEGEEFTIDFVDSVYGLKSETNQPINVYASSDITTDPVDGMVIGQKYYIVGEDLKTMVIIDSETEAVVVDFTRVLDIDTETSVYEFVFTFPSNANYTNGTVFKLRTFDKQ
ncbi:MAG: hypothetical protein IKJ33_00140 [Clostridia bacterium]|nr:hypothetical protein [Clostridia bacterium]